ncbi:hypothetical protein [Streptomyces sp. NPDC048002]|uniref:hypothetical protein n=1 Tax=Streptomyces sp. NPDC048002 TaxID=3154344 RepID=UPI0033DCB465
MSGRPDSEHTADLEEVPLVEPGEADEGDEPDEPDEPEGLDEPAEPEEPAEAEEPAEPEEPAEADGLDVPNEPDESDDPDDPYDDARRARRAAVATGALALAGLSAAALRVTGSAPALVPAAYALGGAVCVLAALLGSRGRTRRALWLLITGVTVMALGDQFD